MLNRDVNVITFFQQIAYNYIVKRNDHNYERLYRYNNNYNI